VARSWGVPPWVVDEAPVDEVLQEIKLHNIELESRRKPNG
jgi:butyrate kinase